MPAAIQPTESTTAPPAHPAAAAVAEPPLLEPAFSVTIDAPAQFRGIVFHPDGTRAFVHVSDPAIDLWPLAVYYWPEILGALAVLLALPALGVIGRRARRPRRAGRVYCRRCNYDLTPGEAPGGDTATETKQAPMAERCPECGTETAKRRPVPGRRMRRRLAMPVVYVLAVGAAYGVMHGARLPREGWMADRFAPRSRLLFKASERLNIPLDPRWMRDTDRVRVLNVAAGRLTRTLCARASDTRFPMSISCDGRRLFLLRADREGMDAIDTASGRTRRTFHWPPWSASVFSWRPVVPSASEPDSAFIVRLEKAPRRAVVERWDLRTGDVAQQFVQPLPVPADEFIEELLPRHLPKSTGAAWLVYPLSGIAEFAAATSRMGSGEGPDPPRRPARLLDERGRVVREFPAPPAEPWIPPQIVESPSPALVVPSAVGFRIDPAPMAGGPAWPTVRMPRGSRTRAYTSLSAGGSHILAALQQREAIVYDARVGGWAARLVVPGSSLEYTFGLSEDGRFAYALAFSARIPNPGRITIRPAPPVTLTLWDLSRIPAGTDESASGDTSAPGG